MSHVWTLRHKLDTSTTTTHINSHVYNSVNCKMLITNYNWSLPFYFAPQALRPLTLSNRSSLWWPLHCEEESKIYFWPMKNETGPKFYTLEKSHGDLPLVETKNPWFEASSSGGNQIRAVHFGTWICWPMGMKPALLLTYPVVTYIIIVPPSRNQNISARLPQTSMRFQLSTY